MMLKFSRRFSTFAVTISIMLSLFQRSSAFHIMRTATKNVHISAYSSSRNLFRAGRHRPSALHFAAADSSHISSETQPVYNTTLNAFTRGQKIKVSILKFGPLGASVMINDDDSLRGLVLQREIAMFREKRDGEDVVIGEELDAYVERIRDDGRYDISLRPLGVDRIMTVKQLVLDALEGSPSGSIPIGDKSPPDGIASYLHGISKKDFKNAVGALYREGLVTPGALETSIIPDEKRAEAKRLAESTKELKAPSAAILKPPRLPSDRDNSKTIFIGNLPFRITKEAVMKVIKPVLGADAVVEIRLSLNEEGLPRGFGYVDLKDESMVDIALQKLKGVEVGDRPIRTDFADPSRRKRGSGDAESGDDSEGTASRQRPAAPGTWRRVDNTGGSVGGNGFSSGNARTSEKGSWSRPNADGDNMPRRSSYSEPYGHRSSGGPARSGYGTGAVGGQSDRPAWIRRSPGSAVAAVEAVEGSSKVAGEEGEGDSADDAVDGSDEKASVTRREPGSYRSSGSGASSRDRDQSSGAGGLSRSKGWVRDAERNIQAAARRKGDNMGGSSSAAGTGRGGNR